jgi:hypothetical protein
VRPAAAAAASTVLALAGCGSTSETSLEKHFRHGIAEIRTTQDKKKLHGELERTLARLRHDAAAGAAAKEARGRAIAGFYLTRKAVESEIAFVENDSGNLPVATRDASRGYHLRLRGAKLLRSAGRLLGVRVGDLAGY